MNSKSPVMRVQNRSSAVARVMTAVRSSEMTSPQSGQHGRALDQHLVAGLNDRAVIEPHMCVQRFKAVADLYGAGDVFDLSREE